MRNAVCFSNWRDGAFSWEATIQNIKDMARLDFRLWPILRFLAKLLWSYGYSLRVTAAKKKGGSGVHDTDPLRAVDAGALGIPHDICREIEKKMNEEFPRSDGRPTCYYHDAGEGRHFHLQVTWRSPTCELGDNEAVFRSGSPV